MNRFASIPPLQTQVGILALHTSKFLSLLALHEAGRLPPLLICQGGALPPSPSLVDVSMVLGLNVGHSWWMWSWCNVSMNAAHD